MTELRVLELGGINWCWYLCATFYDEQRTCIIHFYDRWHNERDAHPIVTHRGGYTQIRESNDNNRTAIAIEYKGLLYAVTNPRYVFDYHDFTFLATE